MPSLTVCNTAVGSLGAMCCCVVIQLVMRAVQASTVQAALIAALKAGVELPRARLLTEFQLTGGAQ